MTENLFMAITNNFMFIKYVYLDHNVSHNLSFK